MSGGVVLVAEEERVCVSSTNDDEVEEAFEDECSRIVQLFRCGR